MHLQNCRLKVVPVVLAFVAFLLSFYVLNSYFSNTLGRITLQGKFPSGTILTLESQNKFGAVVRQELAIGDQPLNIIKRVGSKRLNSPARRVSLSFWVPDTEVAAGNDVINIYNLQIEQPFVGLTVVSKASLSKIFESKQFFGRDLSFLRVEEATGTATMVYRGRLPHGPIAWSLMPAFLLAFIVYLISRSHSFRQLPAIRDMSLGRTISSPHDFNTVNGIRGLAALLVLFSHAAPGFEAVNVGIALLFVISGFLLSKPFVLDAIKVFDLHNIQTYLVKRIKRILPMYYLFIFITYVLSNQFDTALRNFLFIEASGHLWPMTQIFVFYMFLPLILMLTSWVWRFNRLLPVAMLIFAGGIWFATMDDWKPFYNGRYFKEFYLYAFLLGVAGAYVYFDLLKTVDIQRYRHPIALFVLILVSFTIAWSAPVPPPEWAHPFIREFYGKCVLSLVIIILLLQLKGTWVNAIFANPLFRSVGVVGFSFYLLHGLGIEFAMQLQSSVFGVVEPVKRSWSVLSIAFVLTYVMALVTYSYVERPFFGNQNRAS